MNRFFRFLGVITLSGILFSACLKDETTTSDYDNQTAITAFSLGTLQRIMHVKDSAGLDSTYTTTCSGSSYKFDIDHKNGLIFNHDSIIKWVNPKKVLCTVTSANSGAIGYLKPNNDTVFAYSSSDTMDFSQPVEFRVYAAGYPAGVTKQYAEYRKYMVSVNIHQEEGDSVKWFTANENPMLAFEHKKMLNFNGYIYLLAQDGSKTTIFRTIQSNDSLWSRVETKYEFDSLAFNNTIVFKNKLYTLSNAVLYKSENGVDWTVMGQSNLTNLVGAGTIEMYGIEGDKIMYSVDEGKTWLEDRMSDLGSNLPQRDFSCILDSVTSNYLTERVVIVGNRKNASSTDYAVVWSKTIEKRENSESYAWTNVVARDENFRLAGIENLSVVPYGNALVAYTDSTLKYSIDDGLVWFVADDMFELPEDFTAKPSEVTLCVDDQKFLWFLTNKGVVWRARANSMGWKEYQTVFK